jgi:hypothetical protein
MKKIIIILIITLAAIGLTAAITWPMENGAVQLSQISFDQIKNMDNGIGGDLASVGMTKEQAKVLNIEGEGTGLGQNATKAAFIGQKVLPNDPRAMA